MILIRELVKQVLATGYLSRETEEQLIQLLQRTKYGREDLDAFMCLQEAAIAGQVQQESRQLLGS
ncbi:MAG: hypothetical protein SAJ37_18345 [Oscillatoria sp. PMC 1068.18]|nr:hypothetical protein [Oscillatoria sp. PMC 1076.18]MEC4990697.1 hypothetical protein [Oscillatoria sp. PMC 1068.18]